MDGPDEQTPAQRTLAALRARVHEYDTRRAGERLGSAVVRGALCGLTVRGGLHTVSYLVSLLPRKRGARGGPTPAERLIESLRYAAFFGTFGGVYVGADELIAMLLGRKKTRAWRSIVAGALAGPSILWTGRGSDHTSLAMYAFLRGLVLLVRCGNLPGAPTWRRRLLAPTRVPHGDVALMCLAVAQLGYSWMVTPQTLPRSYIRFLNKHGGKPEYMYTAVREMIRLQRQGQGSPPRTLRALRGTPHEAFCGSVPCSFLHRGKSCPRANLEFFPEAFLRALPVYLPVYLVPALFVHRQRLLDPVMGVQIWRRLVLGMLRSSAFLAAFCTLAWVGVCGMHQTAGKTNDLLFMLACAFGGLSLLVEKKSRRMDLAMYCLSRAMESGLLNLKLIDSPLVRHLPRRLDVLLFSVGSAAILHCYSDHFGERRHVIRGPYLSVFDFILGNTGFKTAAVRHAPSTHDMLVKIGGSQPVRMVRTLSASAMRRIRSNPRVVDGDTDLAAGDAAPSPCTPRRAGGASPKTVRFEEAALDG